MADARDARALRRRSSSLETPAEAERFFRDLCTLSELEAMAHRWQVARLLEQGLPYLEIAQRTGASTTTVTRVAHWLRHGEGGYRLALDRCGLLRVAVPVKGRLREPSFQLLEDAGLGPEQPGERALAFPCRNAPVEVLLVRAADVPEYVQDGVVDCGITGLDLVRERGADVDELLRLGFGSCRLEAAVPEESPRQTARGARRARPSRPSIRAWRASCCRSTSSSSTSPARSRSRRGSGSPTRSSTSSRRATRCARTAFARSASLLESEAVLIAPRRRGRRAVRGDAARGRRGARAPLPDAERARVGARRRSPRSLGSRVAERAAARRAGHGRRARARAGGRDLAAPARARSGRRLSILIVPVERMAA